MKYMLLIHSDEGREATMTPAEGEEMMAAYGAYAQALAQAGVMVGGERLRPTSDATVVRTVGGKAQVLNGPFAETREQFGGYFMIEVPDLDAAISWAARCPGASHGSVEIRPIWAS